MLERACGRGSRAPLVSGRSVSSCGTGSFDLSTVCGAIRPVSSPETSSVHSGTAADLAGAGITAGESDTFCRAMCVDTSALCFISFFLCPIFTTPADSRSASVIWDTFTSVVRPAALKASAYSSSRISVSHCSTEVGVLPPSVNGSGPDILRDS